MQRQPKTNFMLVTRESALMTQTTYGLGRAARVARGRGSRIADFAWGRGARGAVRRPPATLPTLTITMIIGFLHRFIEQIDFKSISYIYIYVYIYIYIFIYSYIHIFIYTGRRPSKRRVSCPRGGTAGIRPFSRQATPAPASKPYHGLIEAEPAPALPDISQTVFPAVIDAEKY